MYVYIRLNYWTFFPLLELRKFIKENIAIINLCVVALLERRSRVTRSVMGLVIIWQENIMKMLAESSLCCYQCIQESKMCKFYKYTKKVKNKIQKSIYKCKSEFESNSQRKTLDQQARSFTTVILLLIRYTVYSDSMFESYAQ